MENDDLLTQLRIERPQHDQDDASRWRWPWLIAAMVTALVALGCGFWWWSNARAVPVHTVIAVAPSASDTHTAVLQATGYVTARRKATVSAQIVGTLTQVLIEEGDHVKKGQVLARLEDSSQEARLNSAKANAEAARAQTQESEANLAQDKRNMLRQNTLARKGLVSKQQAEQARTDVAALRAKINAQRKQAKATRAQVQIAQVNYDYTIVRAPFSGVITQKAAQVGEIIAPAAAGGGFTRTGVATIVDMNSLEVDVDVNEAYISRVKPGMAATAVLDAYPDWDVPAHVIAIVPTADRAKATVKVRVALDKKDPRILPDMGVRVSFLENISPQSKHRSKGVLVPASAIVTRDQHKVVFMVHANTARAIQVTPAPRSYGDLKRLPKGVPVGAAIVSMPPASLMDGAHVKVTKSS